MIGRRAPHRLLAVVAGLDGRRLDEALREAVAAKLLVARVGDDGYEFRHALLREVAYADLLPGERARLHGEVAAAIAAHPGWAGGTDATVAAELANHWDAAGDAERPFRPRSRPPTRPSAPTPSPRPSGTSSGPWSCGRRCCGRPG